MKKDSIYCRYAPGNPYLRMLPKNSKCNCCNLLIEATVPHKYNKNTKKYEVKDPYKRHVKRDAIRALLAVVAIIALPIIMELGSRIFLRGVY